MVLKPGESTTIKSGVFMMHEGMDGPHDFAVHLKTNDPPILIWWCMCCPIGFHNNTANIKFWISKRRTKMIRRFIFLSIPGCVLIYEIG